MTFSFGPFFDSLDQKQVFCTNFFRLYKYKNTKYIIKYKRNKKNEIYKNKVQRCNCFGMPLFSPHPFSVSHQDILPIVSCFFPFFLQQLSVAGTIFLHPQHLHMLLHLDSHYPSIAPSTPVHPTTIFGILSHSLLTPQSI